MDPFTSSSSPSARSRRRHDGEYSASHIPSERHKAEPQPAAQTPASTKSSAGLRRSAGLFNLKLDLENRPKPENLDAMDAQPQMPSNFHVAMNPIMTPDSSGAHVVMPPSHRRANHLSLKRPHPFSSAKPTKQSGFLSRSSASFNDTASPAGQKRVHLTSESDRTLNRSLDRSMDRSLPGDMTPDLSFRGAKPVQTAFMSSGLQSKKHVPQSPKPRVPETPCKRPINDSILDKDSSSIHLHHLSPFPGVISLDSASHGSKPEAQQQPSQVLEPLKQPSLSDRLATVPTRCSSPINSATPSSLSAAATSTTADVGDNSPLGKHPVDRLQRFSIGHIHSSTDDLEPPETPTRFSSGGPMVHTSTPLFRYSVGAGRQASEAAVTATPGTAVKPRPLPSVLQSADPADSMSVSPPESLDLNTSIATASSSSPSDTSMHTNLSPRTPDIDEMYDKRRGRHVMDHGGVGDNASAADSKVTLSGESQSSPQPRRRLRLFDLWHSDNHTSPRTTRRLELMEQRNQQQEQQRKQHIQAYQEEGGAGCSTPLPEVPPLRVETPLGRTHLDDYPRTPGHHQPSSSSFNVSQLPISNAYRADPSASHSNSRRRSSLGHISVDHQHPHSHPQSHQIPHDELLASKFERVQSAAFGEFSAVFVVAQGKQRYAVKRTKRPILGQRERLRRREEVDILRTLSSPGDTHIVQLIDEWEASNFGYIMTEYCENGDLSRFLADQGRVSRLEEWRVWKILVEILQGLAVIHSHNILHLDLKPANVFVTFEGHLKIGDFGMATRDPVPPGFEREGDREYIAPEVLELQHYGKPADIFSVGLMMVEIAANIVLPDNGVHWHRLRSGDLSDAGRLSSGDLKSTSSHHSSEIRIPPWAPKFLIDDECLLDEVVSQMLNPQPDRRPTVEQLLLKPELMLVDQRGQAGAVIYEGEFGPEPEMEDETSVWQRA